jgi:hypothetical protein
MQKNKKAITLVKFDKENFNNGFGEMLKYLNILKKKEKQKVELETRTIIVNSKNFKKKSI